MWLDYNRTNNRRQQTVDVMWGAVITVNQ